MDLNEPITTQEQLDGIIKDRLDRAQKGHAKELSERDERIGELEKAAEKYGDWQTEKKDLQDKLIASEAKVKQYETDSVKRGIAKEYGLAEELADRLRGETDEELRADAQNLQKLVGRRQPTLPKAHVDPVPSGTGADLRAAYKKLIPKKEE